MSPSRHQLIYSAHLRIKAEAISAAMSDSTALVTIHRYTFVYLRQGIPTAPFSGHTVEHKLPSPRERPTFLGLEPSSSSLYQVDLFISWFRRSALCMLTEPVLSRLKKPDQLTRNTLCLQWLLFSPHLIRLIVPYILCVLIPPWWYRLSFGLGCSRDMADGETRYMSERARPEHNDDVSAAPIAPEELAKRSSGTRLYVQILGAMQFGYAQIRAATSF